MTYGTGPYGMRGAVALARPRVRRAQHPSFSNGGGRRPCFFGAARHSGQMPPGGRAADTTKAGGKRGRTHTLPWGEDTSAEPARPAPCVVWHLIRGRLGHHFGWRDAARARPPVAAGVSTTRRPGDDRSRSSLFHLLGRLIWQAPAEPAQTTRSNSDAHTLLPNPPSIHRCEHRKSRSSQIDPARPAVIPDPRAGIESIAGGHTRVDERDKAAAAAGGSEHARTQPATLAHSQ